MKPIALDFQGAVKAAPDTGTIVRIRKDGQEAWYWSAQESPIEILEATGRETEITAIIGVSDARKWAAKGIVI